MVRTQRVAHDSVYRHFLQLLPRSRRQHLFDIAARSARSTRGTMRNYYAMHEEATVAFSHC